MNENGRCRFRVSYIYIWVLRIIGSSIRYNQSGMDIRTDYKLVRVFFNSLVRWPNKNKDSLWLVELDYTIFPICLVTFSVLLFSNYSFSSFLSTLFDSPQNFFLRTQIRIILNFPFLSNSFLIFFFFLLPILSYPSLLSFSRSCNFHHQNQLQQLLLGWFRFSDEIAI